MKIIVRGFVVALALTGFVSTAATSNAKVTAAAKASAMPAPTCPPNTGPCGIGQW